MSEVLEETRLANECVREDAVDWSFDCMLLEPVLLFSDLFAASEAGLGSVFKRRMIPDTAYETG